LCYILTHCMRLSTDPLASLAITAPGLAPLAARELADLGIAVTQVSAEGVRFRAPLAGLYAANLWLRTATRVVVRGAVFPAETFYELERRAARVDWLRYITPSTPVRLRVTCRKSRLYHSDAVAERLAAAVVRAGGVMATEGGTSRAADEHDESEQLVVVRLFRDQCQISFDSSGALLHRRGYRQETAKAPIRETLAAALLLVSEWNARGPLLDPLCGSGTVAIEGALIARRRAPGLDRPFAFMHWPGFEADSWDSIVEAARSREAATASAPIFASDRDAGATAATVRNATRAGVAADIEITRRSLSAVEPPRGPGWLVTNPPYGVRVGERDPLRDLYAQLGHVARAKCAGWTVALLAADRALARHTGLPLVPRLETSNGGIPVTMMVGRVAGAAGGARPPRNGSAGSAPERGAASE
jgi:putative N6-adenine-specific DNA methylase